MATTDDPRCLTHGTPLVDHFCDLCEADRVARETHRRSVEGKPGRVFVVPLAPADPDDDTLGAPPTPIDSRDRNARQLRALGAVLEAVKGLPGPEQWTVLEAARAFCVSGEDLSAWGSVIAGPPIGGPPPRRPR